MDLETLSDAILKGDVIKVKETTNYLLSQDISPETIMNEGLLEGMRKVSDRFKEREFCIPEVLISSRATHAGMHIIKPLLLEKNVERKTLGKIVIGTVAGDLHDIGKNMVALLLKSNGFDVIDLGIDVSPEEFLDSVKKHEPDILAMSALLTTTMPVIAETMRIIIKEGYRDKVKIMIGGAPITRDYAEAVGADSFGADASEALENAMKLVKGKK